MRMVVLPVLALLAACSGAMTGQLIGADGRSVGDFAFTWTDDGFGAGEMTALLPDGERFAGRQVAAQSFGTATVQTASGPVFTSVTSSSGVHEAVLHGDRGRSMQCRFRAADASLGLVSGGVGECVVSDGARILSTF